MIVPILLAFWHFQFTSKVVRHGLAEFPLDSDRLIPRPLNELDIAAVDKW